MGMARIWSQRYEVMLNTGLRKHPSAVWRRPATINQSKGSWYGTVSKYTIDLLNTNYFNHTASSNTLTLPPNTSQIKLNNLSAFLGKKYPGLSMAKLTQNMAKCHHEQLKSYKFGMAL